MRSLNGLRTRPSPCSDELTPSNSPTSSTISSATARIVSTSAGTERSTNGRMCRQPTEQWPYQPASSPCRSRMRLNCSTYSPSTSGATAVSSTNAAGRRRPSLAAISSPSPALRTFVSASCSAAVSARSVW